MEPPWPPQNLVGRWRFDLYRREALSVQIHHSQPDLFLLGLQGWSIGPAADNGIIAFRAMPNKPGELAEAGLISLDGCTDLGAMKLRGNTIFAGGNDGNIYRVDIDEMTLNNKKIDMRREKLINLCEPLQERQFRWHRKTEVDIATKQINSWVTEQKGLYSIDCSADSLLMGATEQKIFIFDTRERRGDEVASIQVGNGTYPINSLQWHSGSNCLFFANRNVGLCLLDLRKMSESLVLLSHQWMSCSYVSDQRGLAVDEYGRIWFFNPTLAASSSGGAEQFRCLQDIVTYPMGLASLEPGSGVCAIDLFEDTIAMALYNPESGWRGTSIFTLSPEDLSLVEGSKQRNKCLIS